MISTITNSLIKEAVGNKVSVKATDERHFTEKPVQNLNDDVSTSFKDMFNNAISKVNNLQIEADDLREQMIYEPESVDIHTVQIAAQKAEISLMFVKTIRDQAVQAYREMINLR